MNGWWPLAAAAVLYAIQAYYYWDISDRGLALCFFAYAMANVGFIWDYLEKTT